jgi:hypothetical protein
MLFSMCGPAYLALLGKSPCHFVYSLILVEMSFAEL